MKKSTRDQKDAKFDFKSGPLVDFYEILRKIILRDFSKNAIIYIVLTPQFGPFLMEYHNMLFTKLLETLSIIRNIKNLKIDFRVQNHPDPPP